MKTYNLPCPQCPDGSVWTPNGPTKEICPRCNGAAVLHPDGSKLNKYEIDRLYLGELLGEEEE